MFCLIKTEVVLKLNGKEKGTEWNKFNKNRSCIEIGWFIKVVTRSMQFNKNRSCIEITNYTMKTMKSFMFNKNRSCIEIFKSV